MTSAPPTACLRCGSDQFVVGLLECLLLADKRFEEEDWDGDLIFVCRSCGQMAQDELLKRQLDSLFVVTLKEKYSPPILPQNEDEAT